MTAHDDPLDARTMGEEAYYRLRSDIIAGRMAPEAKLPFRQLSAKYGFGVAPLREALSRLATERLVSFEGQRGFVVAPVSRDELVDLCNLRIMLTTMAFRKSIEKGGYDWEDEVLLSLRHLSRAERPAHLSDDELIDEWERRHDRFHLALIAACGSQWLLRFCTILSDQFQRYRRLIIREMADSEDLWSNVRTQHEAIAEAALARETDKAVQLLADHLNHSLRIVDERFSGAGAKEKEALVSNGDD